jgi:hypothetical protein
MVRANGARDAEREQEEEPMSLAIETHHEERTVLLRCDTCVRSLTVRTLSDSFLRDVEVFFEAHADCTRSVDLTG